MPEIDDCEYCSSSKRLRRGFNNNNEEGIDKKLSEKSKPNEKLKLDMQILLDNSEVRFVERRKYGWNALDASVNIDVGSGDNDREIHRHPVAQSTDAVRSKNGFARGMHLWRMKWPKDERGTHAVVGICNRQTSLHCHGYCSLIGSDESGWGWDIARGVLVHGGRDVGRYDEEMLIAGVDDLIAVLDMDEGTLGFIVNGKYLGVAFTNVNRGGGELFACISCVWGHCQITIDYLTNVPSRPISLLDLCRFTIRRQLGVPLHHLFPHDPEHYPQHTATSMLAPTPGSSFNNNILHNIPPALGPSPTPSSLYCTSSPTNHSPHQLHSIHNNNQLCRASTSNMIPTSGKFNSVASHISQLDIPDYLKHFLTLGSFRR